MIITEEQCVHPSDWPYEKVIHGYRPEVVDGYGRSPTLCTVTAR